VYSKYTEETRAESTSQEDVTVVEFSVKDWSIFSRRNRVKMMMSYFTNNARVNVVSFRFHLC
jgi:hypothetical protein